MLNLPTPPADLGHSAADPELPAAPAALPARQPGRPPDPLYIRLGPHSALRLSAAAHPLGRRAHSPGAGRVTGAVNVSVILNTTVCFDVLRVGFFQCGFSYTALILS